MRRYLRPSLIVFAGALIVSLILHLRLYGVLGKLADALPEETQPREKLVEFELTDGEGDTETPPTESSPQGKPEPSSEPEPEPRRRAERRKPEPRPEKPKPEQPKPEKPKKPEPEPEVAEKQPRKPTQNKLSVKQKTEEPAEKAPDDARFSAEENRRVEEETVARMRNLHRDDEEPVASSEQARQAEQQGNAEQQESADLREQEGSDERRPTRAEAEAEPPPRPDERAGAGERSAPTVARSGERAGKQGRRAERSSRAGSEGGTQEGLVVQDPAGSFRLVTPGSPAAGKGGGDEGGAHREGSKARAGRKGRRGGRVDLKVSWKQFESAYGEEQLKKERQAYLKQRRSKARGGSRQRRWKEFRAALENYVPNVKPGNQTALNAAASPFASWLSDAHRRLHPEFAGRFLSNLPGGSGPFNDMSLHAKLEIAFNRDGSVHKIGIIETSGFLPFDYGAFDAVMRAQPYPEAPEQILSGDGRVYVRWGFYRNHRQCGTFNAEPYIVPHPPGSPQPSDDPPFRDTPPAPSGGSGDERMGRAPSSDSQRRFSRATP